MFMLVCESRVVESSSGIQFRFFYLIVFLEVMRSLLDGILFQPCSNCTRWSICVCVFITVPRIAYIQSLNFTPLVWLVI